jgi:hypothetical protein
LYSTFSSLSPFDSHTLMNLYGRIAVANRTAGLELWIAKDASRRGWLLNTLFGWFRFTYFLICINLMGHDLVYFLVVCIIMPFLRLYYSVGGYM